MIKPPLDALLLEKHLKFYEYLHQQQLLLLYHYEIFRFALLLVILQKLKGRLLLKNLLFQLTLQ